MDWYSITKKYNKLDYKKGSLDPAQGLDCLTLLFAFYEDMGIDLSVLKKIEFVHDKKRYTIDNYTEVEPDTIKRNKVFKVFLDSFFASAEDPSRGDLVLFKFKEIEMIGIYLGNSLMMCAVEDHGIRNIKIKTSLIQRVYRWQS